MVRESALPSSDYYIWTDPGTKPPLVLIFLIFFYFSNFRFFDFLVASAQLSTCVCVYVVYSNIMANDHG